MLLLICTNKANNHKITFSKLTFSELGDCLLQDDRQSSQGAFALGSKALMKNFNRHHAKDCGTQTRLALMVGRIGDLRYKLEVTSLQS